jgi:hypothetical protein
MRFWDGSARVKATLKKLVKLSLWVNFNNILQTAFRHEDPKSTKGSEIISLFLCFWDPLRTKAFCNYVYEIDPKKSNHRCPL